METEKASCSYFTGGGGTSDEVGRPRNVPKFPQMLSGRRGLDSRLPVLTAGDLVRHGVRAARLKWATHVALVKEK